MRVQVGSHTVEYRDGQLVALDHGDVDAEQALAVELPEAGVTITAVEDWTTVWVIRVRTPVDRWEAFLASRWRATDEDGNVHAGWAGGPIDGTRVVMQPAPPRTPASLEVLIDGRRYGVEL